MLDSVIDVQFAMDPHEHYFSFSALESFWENTNAMAQSFTRTTATAKSRSAPIKRSIKKSTESSTKRKNLNSKSEKPPLSPKGPGRPPLSPGSLQNLSWDESVETVLSPQSVDDVRLFFVNDLDDVPDLYDFARPNLVETPATTATVSDVAAADSTTMLEQSDANSLDFTHGTTTTTSGEYSSSSRHRQMPVVRREEEKSFSSESSRDKDEGEELVGLHLLEAEETAHQIVHLDLDFLKQDPPKAPASRHKREGSFYFL